MDVLSVTAWSVGIGTPPSHSMLVIETADGQTLRLTMPAQTAIELGAALEAQGARTRMREMA